MEHKLKQIEFNFQYDPAYRIIPTNGVWGGLTPRGDIKLDFFVESTATPERIINAINNDGSLGEEIERSPNRKLVRHVQVGILMSITEAESIVNFISAKLHEYKKALEDEK